MTTITQVRDAIKAALLQITIPGGYNNTILSTNIYGVFTQEFVSLKSDQDYPKIFIVTDGGQSENLTSYRQNKKVSFNVIVIVKAIDVSDDPQAMIEKYIEDIESQLRQNSTLGGVVRDAQCVEFTTDAGFSNPEGIAVLRVETERIVP